MTVFTTPMARQFVGFDSLFEELNKVGTTIVIATHNEGLVSHFDYPVLHLEDGILTTPSRDAGI